VTGPKAAGTAELEAGDRLGPYVLEARLGHGATGIVYRAVREPGGRRVALKVLRQRLSSDEQFVRRFLREAAVAGAVAHRHLVPIVEAGEVGGRHYLASEYVEGGSLRERLADVGVLSLPEVARVAAGVGAALDALHEAGLVHRDVKPSNVMLTAGGRALLADFGLAKGPAHSVVTRPGELMGTPAYMAPELISGEEATPASDLYALACVLYECVTGEVPFASPSLVEMVAARLVQDPPDACRLRPGLRPSLGSVLGRGLERDPAGRPATCTALAHLVGFAAR
jgi:serine/threonine-protein kinase